MVGCFVTLDIIEYGEEIVLELTH